MDKSLHWCIYADDLTDFQRKTTKKNLKDVLNIYAMDLLKSEKKVCLRYISKYVSLKDYRDNHHRTLLHYAVMIDRSTCEYLIREECNPNIKDDKGKTPLETAIFENCDSDIISFLEDCK